MIRRATVVSLAAALVTGVVVVAGAGALREERPFRLDRQTHKVAGASDAAAGAEWGPVPGLGEILVCGPRGRVAVTVSLDLDGEAVDVRVDDGDGLLQPSEARFDPKGGRTSFSFTFLGSARGDPLKSYDVEWRSAASPADDTRLEGGSALVLWSKTPKVACD